MKWLRTEQPKNSNKTPKLWPSQFEFLDAEYDFQENKWTSAGNEIDSARWKNVSSSRIHELQSASGLVAGSTRLQGSTDQNQSVQDRPVRSDPVHASLLVCFLGKCIPD